MHDVKQVILYRRDLKMRKGKIAAQCAHASLAVFLRARIAPEGIAVAIDGTPQALDPASTLVVPMDEAMVTWTSRGFKKIVLSVDDEEALLEAHRLAVEAGIPCALIRDSGKTEFGGVPTYTTVALGPAESTVIDPISGPEGAILTKLA